jgi:hypothetical protein
MSGLMTRLSDASWVRLLELFAASNLAFLALDVYLAHAVNRFAHKAEWIPVVFSVVAPVLLLPALLFGPRRRLGRVLGFVVGAVAVVVGAAGMVLHLYDSFFVERTLHSLVYTAPFAAPLSYVGLGLLVLLNRMEQFGADWASWILVLALGGFIGNLGLSLLDHAQNGFFRPIEWVSVVAAAFGASFLLACLLFPQDARLGRLTAGVMLGEIAVGVWGFALHLAADLGGPSDTLRDQLIYGAPVFAPLLFTDIAVLSLIGLWARARFQMDYVSERQRVVP